MEMETRLSKKIADLDLKTNQNELQIVNKTDLCVVMHDLRYTQIEEIENTKIKNK